jgi:hypothetical protein
MKNSEKLRLILDEILMAAENTIGKLGDIKGKLNTIV